MSDLIDRSSAKNVLMYKCEWYKLARESHGTGLVEWCSALISLSDAMDAIRDLPSAQPERKKGKWIKTDNGHVEYDAVCSECGFDWMWSDKGYFKYCPHCGADMREGEKDDE